MNTFNINTITIKNFQCYQNIMFTFAKTANVFIGKNGSGKSSMVKAIKNEYLVEHLESRLELKGFLRMTATTSIYTLLSGVAFGFLSTQLAPILVMMVLFSVAFVVAGMYTGYHFGFEQKTKAYVVGAILLWIAGIDVIVRCVF